VKNKTKKLNAGKYLVNRKKYFDKKDTTALRFTQGKRENDLYGISTIFPLST
jgi:hypothetical protein